MANLHWISYGVGKYYGPMVLEDVHEIILNEDLPSTNNVLLSYATA